MLKRYYNSSDERYLKEKSMTMFEEISSGVYHVIKDRMGAYSSFVTSDEVVEAFNNEVKISVTGNSGIYANFDLIKD